MSPLVLPVWQPVCIAYMQDACQLYWLNHCKSHHPWSPCCSFSTLLPFAQKGGGAPNFRPMSIVTKWLDGSRWHGTGPQSRPHCARWGPSSPPQKGGRAPNFLTHFCCGQTDVCINMPLGMEVGLSPGDFVLDGDPVPLPKKGAEPPNFQPMSVVAKRLDGSRCHFVRR